MVGVVRPRRIEYALDRRMPRQRLCQGGGVALGLVEAQIKSMQPTLREPAVKWARRQAPCDIGIIDRGHMGRIAGHSIAERGIGMARHQFGHRMDDDIGPMLERAIKARRGEGIVNDQKRASFFGDLGDAFHIGHADRRVGNHLDNDHPRIGPHRRPHRGGVGRIDKARLDAKARQVLAHQAQGAAIKLIAAQNVVARFEKSQKHRRNSTHPRAGDDAALRPFQIVDLRGKNRGIGMPLAGIAVAGLLGIDHIKRIGIAGGIDDRGLQRRDERLRGALRPAGAAHEALGCFHLRSL